MKIQVRRNVFETNSSSVHTLSIINESDVTEYPKELIFTSDCFGWENDFYNNSFNKAAYLWECIIQGFWKEPDTVQEYINIITKILNKHGITAIFPYNNPKVENNYTYYYDEDGNRDEGYVDHSYEARDFVKAVINDEKLLMNFLFDSKSWILTGNDNQDDDDFLDTPDFGPSWVYEKSN